MEMAYYVSNTLKQQNYTIFRFRYKYIKDNMATLQVYFLEYPIICKVFPDKYFYNVPKSPKI